MAGTFGWRIESSMATEAAEGSGGVTKARASVICRCQGKVSAMNIGDGKERGGIFEEFPLSWIGRRNTSEQFEKKQWQLRSCHGSVTENMPQVEGTVGMTLEKTLTPP